jgi:hypothetical protein
MSAMASRDNETYWEKTQMDLDRITHPLRLAKGSHQPGSGKGCAMNVISFINGDTDITDFPECSARPLAAFVQLCNDLLAGPDDYLSPENSLLALELGWQTVGTADVDETVMHAWVAELLTNPTWGVLRYAKRAARYAQSAADKAVLRIAELHRAVAAGDMPPIAAWDAADRAARRACRDSKPNLHVAGLYAVRAAYHSTAIVYTDHRATLDAVTGNALQAHTLAMGGTRATSIVELTRHAIRSWRSLAALNTCRRLDSNADRSAEFLSDSLSCGTTQVRKWQFLRKATTRSFRQDCCPATGFNGSERIAQPRLPVQKTKLPSTIIRGCSHVDTHVY